MSEFNYKDLETQYEYFEHPIVQISIDGKKLLDSKKPLSVTELNVELSSGFEAGIATISIAGLYNRTDAKFIADNSDVKNYILLGSTVAISLGYGHVIREVFRGFVARVNFRIPNDGMPEVQLTAMDAKGVMMASRHSKKLQAKYYSDAVKEVLSQVPFLKQKGGDGKDFIETVVNDTPDKKAAQGKQETGDRRVEMVGESDYEFLVKAAKKFNFCFYCLGPKLYFTEAMNNNEVLMDLGPTDGLLNMEIEYDISGLVENVEIRGLDVDKGQEVQGKQKRKSTISMGSKAIKLIEKQTRFYDDPTVSTKEEAGYRAEYLINRFSYRLCSLKAQFKGMPELVPGRLLHLQALGKPVSNTFFLTKVQHVFGDNGYYTEVEGISKDIGKEA